MPPVFKKSVSLEKETIALLNKKGWGSDEDDFEDGYNIDDGMYFKLAGNSDDKDDEVKEGGEEDDEFKEDEEALDDDVGDEEEY